LQGYFSQWLNSTGIPEFTLEYVTYRTRKGFRIVGKLKQRWTPSPCSSRCALIPKEIRS